ncbi:MAG: EscU/YscU/HrcU family type III secretion system export apparatus switch protein [Spirochaetota bacterium]|nr:MAG: EscU/YscU/HrcU family type III secretion system export apparatus switch protein [Spirochaetota bacterium]
MSKKAVALKYQEEDIAPRIVAKGVGRLAEVILRLARENNIHIEENRALSEALMYFEAGDYIPEELYEVVAEILAFVYKLHLD